MFKDHTAGTPNFVILAMVNGQFLGFNQDLGVWDGPVYWANWASSLEEMGKLHNWASSLEGFAR